MNGVQGYLAHKKTPLPLGLPWDPRRSPAVGSYGVAFLISEVLLYAPLVACAATLSRFLRSNTLQGCLAYNKTPSPGTLQ